jgi:hypothetical protein
MKQALSAILLPPRYRFADWVVHNWSRAGLLVAVLLLAIAPIMYHSSGRAVFLIYLWLPLYMLHQYEEHGQGKFLEFYQRMMPRIAPLLTERKLLVVNLGIGWLLFVAALYAAVYGWFWLALYVVYLALINAIMHIGQFVAWRSYNPGLWTALVLFLPGAGYTLPALAALGATRSDNLIAFGLGVLAHVFLFALGRGWIAAQL